MQNPETRALGPHAIQDGARPVGRIVVDSLMDIAYLSCEARRPQRVLIRVTPDVDIHGHAAVTTGVNDQKFGFTLGDGHLAEAVKRVMHQPLLTLAGLHCHIGSQITDPTLFGEAIRRMIATMADIRARHGVILPELNIGGGHGVPYVSGDPELDLAELSDLIDDALDSACAAERFPRPRIVVEPGRAISARAGVTLYRVIAVKSQAGGRTFVAVDGGMSDNPRPALYGARYTAVVCDRPDEEGRTVYTIAGKHCESGDVLIERIELPELHPGDLLAVPATGAYNASMASTYNQLPRPAAVMVSDGQARLVQRRETIEDLLAREV
jgi:diaminopimelate decarboxylase